MTDAPKRLDPAVLKALTRNGVRVPAGPRTAVQADQEQELVLRIRAAQHGERGLLYRHAIGRVSAVRS